MGALEGEVALVTGGASGIGRAVVRRYVEEGARVGVMDLAEDRLAELVDELGDSVVTSVGDVTEIGANERAVAATVDAFGKLDVFLANAGLGDAWRELAEVSAEDLARAYEEIFGVNVKGVLLGVKAALPELVRTRGCVIITLSNSSFHPDGGGVMYIGSKHAAHGVMRQLAHELAPVVRVNAVAPGATRTDIRMPKALGVDEHGEQIRTHTHPDNKDEAVMRVVPLAVHADPEDHAGAFVLIASRRDGRVMTGTVIETEAGIGVRGIRRVRGGDELAEQLLGPSG
jgi:2,3-dihydroxy-2,3-dihydrophenylpropionate dehydrogenase